jgi:hypothetical protein
VHDLLRDPLPGACTATNVNAGPALSMGNINIFTLDRPIVDRYCAHSAD